MTELDSVEDPSIEGLAREAAKTAPVVWGLTATELHDAWWRSHGVQVVYRGARFEPLQDAEVFLLLPASIMAIFPIEEITSTLVWSQSRRIPVVLYEKDEDAYREEIRRSTDGGVVGINRTYEFRDSNAVLAAFTIHADEAREWVRSEVSPEMANGGRTDSLSRSNIEVFGHVFHAARSDDEKRFLRSLIAIWPDPSRAISNIKQSKSGVFLLEEDAVIEDMVLIPPLWIGSGRSDDRELVGVGPEFVRDTEARGFTPAKVKPFAEITPQGERRRKRLLPRRTYYGIGKRLFDIVFALIALTFTSPILIAVAVAMILDDGFPIFFGHERQSRGGRQFRCWKLRTMRQNAEELVATLADLNIADGPQVLIENDPRVTRIGRFLRKYQIDELPQFWNVLCGQMSVVGPRPSPEKENQFCPAWREMRLSVRPGVTGLWQVSRTRNPGEDFQEWIKYDVEYVRTASFSGDLKIIMKTVADVLKRD